jgi:hypothetical protein
MVPDERTQLQIEDLAWQEICVKVMPMSEEKRREIQLKIDKLITQLRLQVI